nr:MULTISPECIES: recombinase family protein [Mesorhizobium]
MTTRSWKSSRRGFHVESRRIVSETISGSTAIAQRSGFRRLIDRLEHGDVLVVTKLDRLGRNAIEVSTTVAQLEEMGVKVLCLALGRVDLTSSAGKMTMNVLNAVSQFERDLLVERTQTGLDRAKAEEKTLGPPRPPQRKTTRRSVRRTCQRKRRVSPLPGNPN